MTTTPAEVDEAAVLARITDALCSVLDDCAPDPGTVTMASRFADDLELESIDVVTLTSALRAHYGERIDFPGYFSSLELEEIMDLTVGHLVRHILESLR